MEQTLFTHSPVKASNILGSDVVDPKGDVLGGIKELVVDPSLGRVAYVVVSLSHFLCAGEKLFAIPFRAFRYDPAKSEYILDVSKERLAEAPGFEQDRWPSMSEETWNRDVHAYYESPPYWG
jgi:sporulation protein YlmC with PRC-barrel domain